MSLQFPFCSLPGSLCRRQPLLQILRRNMTSIAEEVMGFLFC